MELNTFVHNTKYDYHNKDNLIEELDEFIHYLNLAYQNIRRMFILPKEQHPSLLQETQGWILALNQLIKVGQYEYNQGSNHD